MRSQGVAPPEPLGGESGCVRGGRVAGPAGGAAYAAALLESLGADVAPAPQAREPHPSIEWARSGAMALTGPAAGAPRLAPAPLASCARGALLAFERLVGRHWSTRIDAPALLGERAAILGLARRGTTSPGGSCRLLRAADGWIAINLARPDDVALLPAWLGEGEIAEPWSCVAARVRHEPAREIVARARLLGLAASVARDPAPQAPPWCRVTQRGPALPEGRRRRQPLVVDLTSLWAGPLCTHLLQLAGARVIKLESRGRPDAARFGARAFFDLLHAGKESVVLDFAGAAGRAQLLRLLERADIVVESSRPRALAQLGIDAESLVRGRPGLTWVSLTGYGRREPGAGWVAFGDDAAVAAGLAAATGGREGPPLFCGDAIADPLTGLHAALAACASWRAGGGQLLDLSLRDVVAHALAFGPMPRDAHARRAPHGWEVVAGRERAVVAPPRARVRGGRARPLGADTQRVLEELGASC